MNTKALTITPFLLLCCNLLFSQTFVHPNGSDLTGTGTQSNPYGTIQKGIDVTSPGGTVNVMSGTYTPTVRTNVTKAITLVKFGTQPAIINASSMSSTFPYCILKIENINSVVIDGLTFKKFIYDEASGIDVWGFGSNITIRNCVFDSIGWTTKIDSLPPNANKRSNALRVQGGSSTSLSNINILNNIISNCATGYSEALTIIGNVNGFLVEGNTIHHISNIGIDIAGNATYTGAPNNVNQARNGIIRNNEVYNCMSGVKISAGIYLDGSINCIVERNKVHHCGAGISLGDEPSVPAGAKHTSGHTIRNNIVYANAVGGMVIGGGETGHLIEKCNIVNNTIFKNVTGENINGVTTINGSPVINLANGAPGEIQLQNSDSVIFQNNIIFPSPTRRTLLGMQGYSTTHFASNYNLYFHDDNTPLFEIVFGSSFNGLSGPLVYNQISNFTTGTGQEANSVFGTPGFTNSALFDFTLTPCALAIDKGNPVYNSTLSGSFDFANNLRVLNNVRTDCGAYEFQTFPSPCTFILSPLFAYCSGTLSLIKLTWGKAMNAITYDIYRNNLLYKSNITDTMYVDTVTASTVYSYYTKAKNGNYSTSSNNSNGVLSITSLNCSLPPSAFNLLAPVALCNGTLSTIKVKWTTSVNANFYDLYRNSSLYKANLTDTQYVDTVSSTVVYTYNVKAKISQSSTITTDNSNGALPITSLNCSLPPSAFNLVPPVASCNGLLSTIKIKWTTAANANFYDLYRNSSLYKANVTDTQYVDTVNSAIIYTYNVKAKASQSSTIITDNSNGLVSITSLNCTSPGIFSLTSAVPQCDGAISTIKLSWSASANATIYDIYRNGLLYKSSVSGSQYIDTVQQNNLYSYNMKARNTNSSTSIDNLNGLLNVTSITCTNTPDSNYIKVFASPSFGDFKIKIRGKANSNLKYQVVGVLGQRIYSNNSNGEMISSNNFLTVFSIKNMPTGIFFVEILIDNKKEKIFKVIKL